MAQQGQGAGRRRRVEGRFAGQQLVQDRAQPVDVGGHADAVRPRVELFGRHVAGRAGDLVRIDGAPALHVPGQAEVGDLRLPVLADQHVARLQVQVQHAQAVRVVQCLGDGTHQARGLARRHRAVDCQPPGQARPAHQRHRVVLDPVVAAEPVDRDDVGMLQARGRARLTAEARGRLVLRPRRGREQLDGHLAVQAALPGTVHHAHAAGAEPLAQFVVAEVALLRVGQVQFQRLGRQEGRMDRAGRGSRAGWPRRAGGRVASAARVHGIVPVAVPRPTAATQRLHRRRPGLKRPRPDLAGGPGPGPGPPPRARAWPGRPRSPSVRRGPSRAGGCAGGGW